MPVCSLPPFTSSTLLFSLFLPFFVRGWSILQDRWAAVAAAQHCWMGDGSMPPARHSPADPIDSDHAIGAWRILRGQSRSRSDHSHQGVISAECAEACFYFPFPWSGMAEGPQKIRLVKGRWLLCFFSGGHGKGGLRANLARDFGREPEPRGRVRFHGKKRSAQPKTHVPTQQKGRITFHSFHH